MDVMTKKDWLLLAGIGILIELTLLAHMVFAAERFEFFAATGDSVRLVWSANTEPDLNYYRIHAISASVVTEWTTADTTMFDVVPLASFWQQVTFYLTAVDHSGNESAASDSISTIMCREPRLVGDIDGNGKVNVIDKALYWLSAGTKRGDLRFSERADLNGDGAVNVIDKGFMQLNAGR